MFFYILLGVSLVLTFGMAIAIALDENNPKDKVIVFFQVAGISAVVTGLISLLLMTFVLMAVVELDGETHLESKETFTLAENSKVRISDKALVFVYVDGAKDIHEKRIYGADDVNIVEGDQTLVEVRRENVVLPGYAPWSVRTDTFVTVK